MKVLRRAKGFTLVELLIVIIIIGILSATVVISTGSATDKAEAAKIVSDLKNIQAASVMYYSDNNSWPSNDITVLNEYMVSELKIDGNYSLEGGSAGEILAVYSDSDVNDGVLRKVEKMSEDGAPIIVDMGSKRVELTVKK